MLHLLSVEEMEGLLRKERYYAQPDDLHRDAQRYIDQLDDRLDYPLSVYAREGKCIDFEYGDISLLTIKSLRRCGFLEAALLMDLYIKDPTAGMARIVRR